MAVQTIAGRVAQYGLQKNSGGTYIANGAYPSWSTSASSGYWLKWRQGSMVTPKMDYAFEFEGDGSRGEALGYRKLQYGVAKHTFAPRPNEAALFLAAFSGTGSDTVVATANNLAGTIAAVASTGYQTVALTLTSGKLYPGQIVSVAAGGGTAETVVAIATQGTNAATGSPTSFTAVFTSTHSAATAVTTAADGGVGSGSTHVIQPNLGSNNDFYDLVQQLPSALGSNAYVMRLHNAICNGLTLQVSTSAPVLIFDADWTGIQNSASNPTTGETALSTATSGILGFQTEGPYYFYQTSNVAFPQASLAPAIKDISLKCEYTLTPSDFQTDSVTPLPYIAGNMTITGDVTVLWQDGGMAAQTYFGSTTGTADAGTNVTGSMGITFANASTPGYTISLAVPNCAFQSAEFTPDLSGKPIEQKLSFHALRYPAGSGTATPIYSAAVVCSNSSAF